VSHLLAISVGPVQEFIAAARRTRDLWFGSYLLSEISRSVAVAVAKHGGPLIFPSAADAGSVANIIIAEWPSGDPATVVASARSAAKDCWRSFAERSRDAAGSAIDRDVWNDQVDDVLEFFAAWTPQTGDYAKDRRELMRLLGARKATREFAPAKGRSGLPKSSLDGRRETVLKPGDRTGWPTELRLARGEQLDAVGIAKRLGREPNERHPRYPSVARVAAEAWLAGNADKVAALCKQCRSIGRLNEVREPCYRNFPYEGTILYRGRHKELQQELKLEPEALAAVARLIGREEPTPYLAILVADGDNVGRAIDRIASPEKHRDFSALLAQFAGDANDIVNEHRGVPIYTGGDDVLALLPVHTALECARALRDRFTAAMGPTGPTLSVGIAITHFMESLEDAREAGRRAELAAKAVPDKDAMAVALHKRSGAPISVAARWSDRPDERLTRFARLINDGVIPRKLPYELRLLETVYQNWQGASADEALQADVRRLVGKKASADADLLRKEVESVSVRSLPDLAAELLIARLLQTVKKQSGAYPKEAGA
jgi:CRISPR-associated protein Cmr2